MLHTLQEQTLLTLRLEARGRCLRDALGRTVLLRGVNAGGRSKTPPFLPFPFAELGFTGHEQAPPFEEAMAAYFDRVAAWGHNVVRLPFTWEAVEPHRGIVDMRFVELYAQMAQACGDRGIRVVVDYHQDIFSRHYGGDGFPDWTLPDPPGAGPLEDAHWFSAYFHHAGVQQAFDRFWRGDDGLLDAFERMWRTVARRLWQVDAVIGFEIINEPGWGSADWKVWEREVLPPFYTRMARAIRDEVGEEALIFFDGSGADALSGECGLERPDGEGLVFAPHYYDAQAVTTGVFAGGVDYVERLGLWEQLGERWGVPVLLGEFGLPAGTQGGAACLQAQYAALDHHAMHGTAWHYSLGEDWNDEGMSVVAADGSETSLAAELVRPYPRALTGTLEVFRYHAETRVAELRWQAAVGVSEVAAPRRLYPGGPEVSLEGAATQPRWDAERDVLELETLEVMVGG